MEPDDPFPPAQLDRVSALRNDQVKLAQLWERGDARFVAVRDGAIAVPGPLTAGVLGALPDTVRGAPVERRALLGVDADGRPWWLVRPDARADDQGLRWLGLREIGPQCSALEIEVLMTAVALEAWHSRHGFCPTCGHPTDVVSAGWVRHCSTDGSEHYPRTDPAIIVLVIDGQDRALLGRQARWPARWRSALAGFVEPGERAESAVRREVAEEVGLVLNRMRYVASQPWPFPGSLMLGFHAWSSSSNVMVDGVEIAEADWYARDQLQAAASSGLIQLPPSISIARGLIERWFGRPLPGSWLRG